MAGIPGALGGLCQHGNYTQANGIRKKSAVQSFTNTQSTDIVEVIKDARERITEHGWSHTHTFWPPEHLSARDALTDLRWRIKCPATLYGALLRLDQNGFEITQTLAASPLLVSTQDAAADAALMIGQVAQQVFPSRCGKDYPWESVHTFNNHPDTVVQDVVDVLDAALDFVQNDVPVGIHSSEPTDQWQALKNQSAYEQKLLYKKRDDIAT